MFKPQRLGALIFVRAITSESRRKIGKFAQHAAAAAMAFDYFHLAAADERDAVIFSCAGGVAAI
jgi:hypothetical protein